MSTPPTPTPPGGAPAAQQPVAVWYFVGATFVFASSLLIFPDAGVWFRIVTLAAGIILVAAGGFQLRREVSASRATKADDGGRPDAT